jgi:hypothetical protein
MPSASRSRAACPSEVRARPKRHATSMGEILDANVEGPGRPHYWGHKGIGFEIARQLGQGGNRILIGARDRNRGQTAVAELMSEGVVAR